MTRIPGHYSILPPVVKILLIVNGGMFAGEQINVRSLVSWLALWPNASWDLMQMPADIPHFWPWQLVTYAFLHGSVLHLLLNMYALWLFGTRLENLWGSRLFTLYYFTCVLGAAFTQLLVYSLTAQSGELYPTLGASGGVFGLLLAFGLIFPNEIVMLLFPPIPLKAKWFVIGYGAIELWAGVAGTETGIAHFAHLGGMLSGYLLLHWLNMPRRRG